MFKQIFVGGTFDGLHKGHEAILAKAFSQSENVTIGVTSDEFVKHYKANPDSIRPHETRKTMLGNWLTEHGFDGKYQMIKIDDPWEPAASATNYEAIITTRDNKFRSEEINVLRKKRNLPSLTIVEQQLLNAVDGRAISSTRVRKGEIDSQGRLIMPETLRTLLQKPLGKILIGTEIDISIAQNKDKPIIAVGDITTETLLSHGVVPSLAVIDTLVSRKPYKTLEEFHFPPDVRILPLQSGPGYVATQAIDVIKVWSLRIQNNEQGQRKVIVVDGEEDLLTLPAMAYAPVGAVLYYGQPNEGINMVEITEAKKQEAEEYLNQFL